MVSDTLSEESEALPVGCSKQQGCGAFPKAPGVTGEKQPACDVWDEVHVRALSVICRVMN